MKEETKCIAFLTSPFTLQTSEVPWSNGNDAWLTSRKRWFNSIRDYCDDAQIRQLVERSGLNPGVCRFDSCSGHKGKCEVRSVKEEIRGLCSALLSSFTLHSSNFICPRGAARSARLPVTQEIVGSNPIGDAALARYANRQSDEAQTFMIVQVRLLPASLDQICVGWALASLSGRNPPAFGLWRFDSVPTHFSPRRGAMLVFAVSLSSSPTRVRFPSASLERRCGGTGRHATLRTSCPAGVGVRISPSSLNHCGWASAHSGLISLDSRVRPPDPRLWKCEV